MSTPPVFDPRAELKTLSGALLKLHKALVDLETQRFGPVGSPFEHLQLLTGHPQFAWLRQLSEIMVELDERLNDRADLDPAVLPAFKTTLRRLLSLETDADFYTKYVAALQESIDVAVAHAELRHCLARPAEPPAAADTPR